MASVIIFTVGLVVILNVSFSYYLETRKAAEVKKLKRQIKKLKTQVKDIVESLETTASAKDD